MGGKRLFDIPMMQVPTDEEVFVPCVEYPAYAISNMGRVKRVVKGGSSSKIGKIMKPVLSEHGYYRVILSDSKGVHCVRVHRLMAKAFLPNSGNLLYVDHINGNRKDNTLSNLRWCTKQENLRNRMSRPGSSSKYKGVAWDKFRQKWKAYIGVDGKIQNIGRYNNEEDAARAHDVEARRLHKEFAKLNFPEA